MDAALLSAVRHNNFPAVVDCLARGARPTAAQLTGDSALHLAADAADSRIARALVAAGASVNTPSHRNRMPLHRAAMVHNVDVCRLLLSAGADAHAVNGFGSTALHYAVYGGSVDCVTLLLAAGVDVLAKNSDGRTALTFYAPGPMRALLRDAAAAATRWAGVRRLAVTTWCSWAGRGSP